MNSNYTIERIISEYKDKELIDILVELGQKMEIAELYARKVRKDKDEHYSMVQYIRKANSLLNFLGSGLVTRDVKEFRVIIENLVKKQNLLPSALDAIDSL